MSTPWPNGQAACRVAPIALKDLTKETRGRTRGIAGCPTKQYPLPPYRGQDDQGHEPDQPQAALVGAQEREGIGASLRWEERPKQTI